MKKAIIKRMPVRKALPGYIGYNFILEFLWKEWQCLKAPALELHVVGFRITHSHQMAHAPRHHCLIRLYIPVAPPSRLYLIITIL